MKHRKIRQSFLVALFLFLTPLAATAADASDYYPLAQGLTWQYEVRVTEFGETRDPQEVAITNLAPQTLNGEQVSPRLVQSVPRITFFVANHEDGICLLAAQPSNRREPEVLDTPDYFIKEPLEVGTTWMYKDVTMTIEAINESVTVPAGTFEGCLRIKRTGTMEGKFMGPWNTSVEMDGFEWYAPAAGLIKSEGNRHYPKMDYDETVTWNLKSFSQ
jgi:hypothetical protein